MPMKRAYKPRPKEQRHASYLRWYAKYRKPPKYRIVEGRKITSKRHYDSHNLSQRLSNRRAKAKRDGYACNIELTEIETAAALQQGYCAICRKFEITLHIDHCHETGRFRGLLCGECNLMLGKAGDNPVRLRAGTEYLERSRPGVAIAIGGNL